MTTNSAGDVNFEGDLIVETESSWAMTGLSTTYTLPPSTVSSASASASAKPTACSGNQVQESCVGGSLPSATPYSGPVAPSCDKADGSAGSLPRINETQAINAANTYCNDLVNQKTVLSATSTTVNPLTVKGVAENGASMTYTILYDVNYCPSDKSVTTVDFGAMGESTCFTNLYTALATCAQDSTWTNYNPQYTLEGGVYGYNCALWSLGAN